eukprot:228588-Pelagomonas_calceolata.AAC.1
MATEVAVLLLGGLELFLGLVSSQSCLGRWTLEAFGVAVAGVDCSLFPTRPPLLLNRYWELGNFDSLSPEGNDWEQGSAEQEEESLRLHRRMTDTPREPH